MEREGEYHLNLISSKANKEKILISEIRKIETKIKRKVRNDKKHNIKFPTSKKDMIRLKHQNRKLNDYLKNKRKEIIPQTKFNTKLLEYGLKNEHLINWNISYETAENFMHVNLLEKDYEKIGGQFGYGVTKLMSDRKITTIIILSVLEHLERNGNIHEIFK